MLVYPAPRNIFLIQATKCSSKVAPSHMAKSNEIVCEVDFQATSSLEPASQWHSGSIQYPQDEATKFESPSSVRCSGESETENSVPEEKEVLNELAPAGESVQPNDDGKSPLIETESGLVSKLRENIVEPETSSAAMRDSAPEKLFSKSSELWCQLVTANEKVKNLEQQCAVLLKRAEAAEARALSGTIAVKKSTASSERSRKSRKYLSRKLQESQIRISELQAANDAWSRLQVADPADFGELKAQFISCACAFQEQVKFSTNLIVEKHRLEAEMEGKIASEDSSKKAIALMEKHLACYRRTVAELKTSLSTLKENFRETRTELAERKRINELLREFFEKMEVNHTIEMDFLNSILVRASIVLTAIHQEIQMVKKKNKLVRMVSRFMGLNKKTPSAAKLRETSLQLPPNRENSISRNQAVQRTHDTFEADQ